MGIRDLLMLVLGYACVPLALYNAYYGLLAYCWLSFMRPQTLVWNPTVQAARITFAVAAALIFRALFTEGPRFRLRGPTLAFLALWGWFAICTLTSTDPASSQEALIQFSKLGVACLLLTGLVRSRWQLKWLIVLLALCPGVYGLKLGAFFARGFTATEHGGPMGMDNNDTAMFIATGIPLLVFAASQVRRRWLKYGLYAAAGLSVPAVLVTGSRGGILAMGIALGLTIWRKTTWWKAVIVAGCVGMLVLTITPEQTMGRYETMERWEQDPSAMGRIRAWEVSMAMAADRATGVGFGQGAYLKQYDNYKAEPEDFPHAAHSVWFSLLGETGYIGLILYTVLVGSVVFTTERLMRRAAKRGEKRASWDWNYAAGLQGAILTFAIGGTFLSQARFEFVYALCMTTVPLAHLAEAGRLSEAQMPATLSSENHEGRLAGTRR